MSFLFIGFISLIVVAVLGLLLGSLLRYITPNQVLLFGTELTLAGGVFIIGLKDTLAGIETVGLILVLTGLLLSVIGFFKRSIRE